MVDPYHIPEIKDGKGKAVETAETHLEPVELRLVLLQCQDRWCKILTCHPLSMLPWSRRQELLVNGVWHSMMAAHGSGWHTQNCCEMPKRLPRACWEGGCLQGNSDNIRQYYWYTDILLINYRSFNWETSLPLSFVFPEPEWNRSL